MEQKLKMVKRAVLKNDNGVFIIEHYDTKIFEYNPKNKEAWCLLNCSVTSNKQIYAAIEFFGLKASEVKADLNKEKWGYHT